MTHRTGFLLIAALAAALALASCRLGGDDSPQPPPAPAPGALDTAFGTAGVVTTSIGAATGAGGASYDYAYCIAVQEDGKAVAAGTLDNQRGFALARYNLDGSLDNTFGTGGKVATLIAMWDEARAVAIQADGKIVVAGFSSASSYSYYRFALVRYLPDGSLDNTFGTGGIVTTAIGSTQAMAYSIALQADGKIVLSGTAGNGFALARYGADGALDTAFGSGGTVVTELGSGLDVARSVLVQADGRIVAAGDVNDGSRIALVRYGADGSLDGEFEGGGLVVTDIGTSMNRVGGALLQPNGKIVIAGTVSDGAKRDFALARYNADGTLDNTFGTGGTVRTALGAGYDEANGVAVQSDGKLVAAGASSGSGRTDFALARYNADGSLDAAFGTGGKVTTAIGTGDSIAQAVALRNGGIFLAGYWSGGSDSDFALARYRE